MNKNIDREPKFNKDKHKGLLDYADSVKYRYRESRKKLTDIAKQNKLQIKLDKLIDKLQLKIERIKNKRKYIYIGR